MTRSEKLGHFVMLCFSALVAGSHALGGLVAGDMAPLPLMTLRFLLAAIVIGALVAIGPGFRGSDFRASWRYLLAGGIFATYFVLMFEALKTAPPVNTAALFTLVPVFTAGFGWLIMRQVTTGLIASALAIGAVGALWVVFRGDLGALLSLDLGYGEAVYALGVVAHAIYIPLLQRLNRGEHGLVFTFGVLMGGGLLLLVLSFGALIAIDWSTVPLRVWLVLAYLVVFSTAISFYCLQFASSRLPAAKVMAYGYLTPSWVILWELALGHGGPSPTIFVGIAVTVVALLMLLRRKGAAAYASTR
ncbi:DMT family transporter [Aliiroseovarius sp. KMU-50]|uniref:DMT family transporter n=1 Tax=Aliiroseovarius salicola TaxID=3009082 RepID=A0ABT4W139_9RHOB|nr:DMT family transporter [Aliiroseovarius sp. KMU-50]MDA5093542.1 DMT family transporter [Aliiroseovarius sp. KMU-50]